MTQLLDRNNCGLIFVDVQGELARKVHQSQQLMTNLTFLIQSLEVLGIPIIWLEQYPKGLGTTVPEIKETLQSYSKASPVLEKMYFNGMSEPSIKAAVKDANCQQWLVVGIEAHVCVYQTVMGLINANYSAYLLCDAIASLREEDMQLAVKRLTQEGAHISSVEMAVFELLEAANNDEFKAVLSFIKQRQEALRQNAKIVL